MHNSKENKKAELEITKNLENERRRITRLLRVMTNSGLGDIPSGNFFNLKLKTFF